MVAMSNIMPNFPPFFGIVTMKFIFDMNWKQIILLAGLLIACNMGLKAQDKTLSIQDVYIRDPFILVDTSSCIYYMYRTAMFTHPDGHKTGGVEVLKSKDLEHWSQPKQVLAIPDDNWSTGNIWAPEVHAYQGKYYLFANINSDIVWQRKADTQQYILRGTQIFWADSPEGPFQAFGDRLPHTPIDQMALDGTLYVENGKPYMVYCHEWVQTVDGTMNLIPLKQDLSAPDGTDIRLFNASAAPWSTGTEVPHWKEKGHVTDGCFLYKTKTGKLLMIWSSFYKGDYAIGIAESTTGRIIGPWKQQPEPFYAKNGGHGMLFKDLNGELCLILHGPNSPAGAERAHIIRLEDTGDSLRIKE